MGANGDNIGEGIQMTGPANVICFNRVTGFRDCISTMEEQQVTDQSCIDIYNNDIDTGADDGIEADFCFHNCRIMRNRLTNCFVGLSSQPGLGGPTYFIRNVDVQPDLRPLQAQSRQPRGRHPAQHGRQGGRRPAGLVRARCSTTPSSATTCASAARRATGAGAATGPAAARPPGSTRPARIAASITTPSGRYETPFDGAIGQQRFSSLEELRRGPHEVHAVKVDLGVFDGVTFPDPAAARARSSGPPAAGRDPRRRCRRQAAQHQR